MLDENSHETIRIENELIARRVLISDDCMHELDLFGLFKLVKRHWKLARFVIRLERQVRSELSAPLNNQKSKSKY